MLEKESRSAKACSEGVLRSLSIFHLYLMYLKKSFCTQTWKKKNNPTVYGLILLTKGKDCMFFCANSSLRLISSQCFYLLFVVVCLSSFTLFVWSESHSVFSPGEGHWRVRRPTSSFWPWAFVSRKQDCLWENKPHFGWWRGTHDLPAVSFHVYSYWDCTYAFTYTCAQISHLQLLNTFPLLEMHLLPSKYELFKPLLFFLITCLHIFIVRIKKMLSR